MPPSFSHEILLELVRKDSELARALIGDDLAPRSWKPTNASAEFVQYPTQRRADNVTLFHDERNRRRLAVIIEVQRKIDRKKKHSWPSYVVEARNTYRCPIYLIVIAFKPHVVKWARASIKLGHPGFILTPIVITKERIPLISTATSARLNPHLAVVSAIAHRDLQTAMAALHALRELPPDMRFVYWSAIVNELSPTKRRALEAQMDMDIPMPSFLPNTKFGRELQARGRGRMVWKLAKAKAGKVSRETAAAIKHLALDEEKLDQLFLRLLNAKTERQATNLLATITRRHTRAVAAARTTKRPSRTSRSRARA